MNDGRPATVRIFYCVSKACTAIQIDDRIIYMMDGPQPEPKKVALVNLIKDSTGFIVETYNDWVCPTNDKIFEAFEAAR